MRKSRRTTGKLKRECPRSRFNFCDLSRSILALQSNNQRRSTENGRRRIGNSSGRQLQTDRQMAEGLPDEAGERADSLRALGRGSAPPTGSDPPARPGRAPCGIASSPESTVLGVRARRPPSAPPPSLPPPDSARGRLRDDIESTWRTVPGDVFVGVLRV